MMSASPTASAPVPRDRSPDRLAGLHAGLGLAFAAALPVSKGVQDIVLILLVVVSLLRLPHTGDRYRPLLALPVIWLLLAWPAWHAISLLWSEQVGAGLTDLRALRAVLIPFVLWPVAGRGRALILAFVCGVLFINATQAMVWLDLLRPFGYERQPFNRVGGLLHPIHAAALCAVAVSWLLCSVTAERGRWRVAGIAAIAITAAGLLATGSRGPWLSALVAVPVTLVILAVRVPRSRRSVIVLAIVAIVATGVAANTSFVQRRVNDAVTQFQAALDDRELASDVGLRVRLWEWAFEQATAHPVAGTGAGEFKMQVEATPAYQQILAEDPAAAERLAGWHAHSSYMQIVAGTGLVGLAIALGTLVLFLVHGLRDREDPIYAAGTVGAILSWCVGAAFDSYHIAGMMACLLTFACTLTLPGRTAAAAPTGARDAEGAA